MKFGVVIFPGSNCDRDMIHVLETVSGNEVQKLWHKDLSLDSFSNDDCIVLPGGFSYGDYLRPGAIARFSNLMDPILEFANKGGLVWGICNGFQILCEMGLLPGVLLRNSNQRFICKNVYVRTETNETAITQNLGIGSILKIPIAHADGRYYTDKSTLADLNENYQVLFRYCDARGIVDEESNPNGSVENIAGICDKNRRVFGMMPHPERSAEDILGNNDGRALFESLLQFASVG